MAPAPEALPDDVAALKAALVAERARGLEVAAELAVARAKASEDMALIAVQKLQIAKLQRQIYGQRSERSTRPIEQLALEFEELAASATEDELAAEQAAAKTTTVRPFTRRRAERDTFPDHLPRERVVVDPPTACACCGGKRLHKLGEDVTRTLETTPRRRSRAGAFMKEDGSLSARPACKRRPRILSPLFVLRSIKLAMPGADDFTPADTSDLADAIAYALRFQGRKRVHNADEIMAEIVAKRLVEHRERAGFVVMKKPADVGAAALGPGFSDR